MTGVGMMAPNGELNLELYKLGGYDFADFTVTNVYYPGFMTGGAVFVDKNRDILVAEFDHQEAAAKP